MPKTTPPPPIKRRSRELELPVPDPTPAPPPAPSMQQLNVAAALDQVEAGATADLASVRILRQHLDKTERELVQERALRVSDREAAKGAHAKVVEQMEDDHARELAEQTEIAAVAAAEAEKLKTRNALIEEKLRTVQRQLA